MATSADLDEMPAAPVPRGMAAMASSAPVDLGGRCEIMPGTPIQALDGVGGSAFAARMNRDRRTEVFAIITDQPVPARIEMMSAYRAIENPALLRLLDWGTIDWPLDQRRHFTLVYERPGGRRMMQDLGEVREGVPDDQITRAIMPSLLLALREMNARGMTCGALRPTNLFQKDAASPTLVIGDCLATPVGYGQPILMETIERGMAQPAGRGPGMIGDDLYALGVTLLILHLGRSPVADLDNETILKLKMDKGTYAALTSQIRLPQSLVEPLRGLMTDDPKQRWSLSDLDMWLQGRRMSPRQPAVPRRAARAFDLQGEQSLHCRALARSLARHSAAAAALIERGEVEKWVRRSVGDEGRAEAMQTAVASAAAGRGASQEDRLVTRVAIALDPPAPIRYRGVSVMPDGVGTALAEAMWQNTGVQPFAEIITGQFPHFWVNCQADFRPEYVPTIQAYDGYRALLEHVGMGFGIERIVYELCPACPCLSPQLRDYYVLGMAELLSAMDHLATKPTRGRDPADRHVLAYITTHHKKLNDRLLVPLSNPHDPARRMVAMISVLAEVQNRFGPARLPHLCGWLVALMDPVFKRFKNRETRERLKTEVAQAARDGVLDGIVRIIDNIDTIRADDKGFLGAMRQYENLSRQIDKLRGVTDDRSAMADGAGRQIAAVVTAGVAAVIMIGTVLHMLGLV